MERTELNERNQKYQNALRSLKETIPAKIREMKALNITSHQETQEAVRISFHLKSKADEFYHEYFEPGLEPLKNEPSEDIDIHASNHNYRKHLNAKDVEFTIFFEKLENCNLENQYGREDVNKYAGLLKNKLTELFRWLSSSVKPRDQFPERDPSKEKMIKIKNKKYKDYIDWLQGRASSYFRQLSKLDLGYKEDREEALRIGRRFRRGVDDLCWDHLGEGSKRKEDLKLKNLELGVERVHVSRGGDKIRSYNFLVGMKNCKSFLITASQKKLRLIEDGKKISSITLQEPLLDILYVPLLNCYFLAYGDKLFRKDINNEPPYLYLDIKCFCNTGACLRYSDQRNKLIISKTKENITVVDPKTRKVEIDVPKTFGGTITDFRLFGEQEDKAVALTWDTFSEGEVDLILYNLDYDKNIGSVRGDRCKIKLTREGEDAASLAVSEKNDYVLVELKKSEKLTLDPKNDDVLEKTQKSKNLPTLGSRMLIFKVNEDSFQKTETIDLLNLNIGYNHSLECLGCAGRHILWIGVSTDEEGLAQVYDYDTERKELREMKDKRVRIQEYHPYKLLPLNGKFYYVGKKGKLMRLVVSY